MGASVQPCGTSTYVYTYTGTQSGRSMRQSNFGKRFQGGNGGVYAIYYIIFRTDQKLFYTQAGLINNANLAHNRMG